MKMFSSREAPADLLMILGVLILLLGGVLMRPLLKPRPEFFPDGTGMRDEQGHTVYNPESSARVRAQMRPYGLAAFAGLGLAAVGVVGSRIRIERRTMTTTRYILPLLLSLLAVSCSTLTPQSAKEYLAGKWQFDREAPDKGYLDEMADGDNFFMAFSGNEVVMTFVEKKKVKVDTGEINLIRIAHDGAIHVWHDSESGNPTPDCVFTRIDNDHMVFAMYDFYGPMIRMKIGDVIPGEAAHSGQTEKEPANQ